MAGAHEFLVRGGEEVVHGVARYEGCGAERDVEFVAGAVVVADSLAAALGDADGEEGGYEGRVEVVEGGVDVPAVEVGVVAIIVRRDGVLVEGLVVRVAEGEVAQAFVFGDEAVADDLDLGLVRHGFEIRVQDAAFGVEGFAVAVAVGARVEALGELELGFGREAGLVFEYEHLVLVEGGSDQVEVGIWSWLVGS